MVRRIGLAVVVVIAIVLIAVLVNSCETSARNSALKDYNNSVASLNARSVQTGSNFFNVLSGGTSDPTSLQQRLNQAAGDAATELSNAKGLSVPDEVKGAQQDFVSALQMRKDGMTNIASDVQPALQSQTEQERGQHDRGGDGQVLRVRRALQGLHRPADRRRAARGRDHRRRARGPAAQLATSSCPRSNGWTPPTWRPRST